MIGRIVALVSVLVWSGHTGALAQSDQSDTTEISHQQGPYLGQKPPGLTSEPFEIVGLLPGSQIHGSPAFTPDGQELYISVFFNRRFSETILVMRQVDGKWDSAGIAPFSGRYFEGGPVITPDGRRLFWGSNRSAADNGENKQDRDIWFVEITEDGWGPPQPFEFNTGGIDERMSIAANGNMYFRRGKDLYFSKFTDGTYAPPERLPNTINTDDHTELAACIAPDESYLIFGSSRPGGIGANDLYVSFRKPDGTWTTGQNMGQAINWVEENLVGTRFPKLSPDGRYMFFTKLRRGGDIPYWVDARIVETLRPKD